MDQLFKKNFETAIYNKARDIDVAIYNAIDDETYKDMLSNALMLYLNEDGGFGQAFYIDNYNPNSTAYTTYQVLKLIYEMDLDDEIALDMINQALTYLYKKAYRENNLFLKAEPSNNKYPRHNDFTYPKEKSLAPTLGIIGLTLLLVKGKSTYYHKALDLLEKIKKEVLTFEYNLAEELLNLAMLIKGLEKHNLPTNIYVDLLHKYLDYAKFMSNDVLLIELNNYYSLDSSVVKELVDNMWESRNSLGLFDYDKRWNNEYPEGDVAEIKWIGAISVKYYYYLQKFKG